MNPACVGKKEILMNLVLVAVFRSSPDCVVIELVAGEYPEWHMRKV